ncbi:AMP-binding protein, partial [Streptomyces nanhaiensis]|uniref:AMP-binding protein n=2 Tax=Streptomyces nanhaiensis TaxID=679319 RepID=UPI00399C6F02
MADIVRTRSARGTQTPAEVLRALSEADPGHASLRVIRPGGAPGAPDIVEHTTRGELHRRARAIAAALHDRVAPGDRVLALLPGGTDLFATCQGAWHLGAAAVPIPPPPPGDRERGEWFVDVATDAEVSAVVTTRAVMNVCRPMLERGAAAPVAWLCLDELPATGLEDPPAPARPGPTQPALLLYTSGSTSRPKGVTIPHAQLRATLELQRERSGLPDGGHVVNWLPAHHALGLGSVLLAQYVGGSATLIDPADFVAEPMRWLRAVGDAGAPVLSGGPPFGYERCTAAATEEECAGLDLSHWSAALIGAERIRARTLEEFSRAFSPYGFRREALFPAYGLTETMLIVTGHRGPRPPLRLDLDAEALEHGRVEPADGETRRVRTLIGCGSPGVGAELLIVDPDTRQECPPGRVGEVWISGSVVMDGYWRRTVETAATFHGVLADGGRHHLRTGDLGFLHDGELVVCGRLKELVIVRGRNLHPQDIELTCRQAHPPLAGLPAAAFSVERDDEERLVVVQGVDDAALAGIGDPAELAAELGRAVTAAHEVDVYAVVLVPHRQVPRTASGKVRRTACRTAFDAGELRPLATARGRRSDPGSAAAAPAGEPGAPLLERLRTAGPGTRTTLVAGELRRLLGAALGIEPRDVAEDRTLLRLGLDSLRTMELRSALHRELGVLLPMSEIGGGTVRELAGTLAERLPETGAAETPVERSAEPATDPESRHEPFPLTDLQHAYLVGRGTEFPLGGVSTHFFAEFDATGLDTVRLRTALDRMVARHGMLRAVIGSDGTQRVLPPERTGHTPVVEYDLRGAGAEEVESHLASVRERMSHDVLPLDRWPLFDIRVTVLDGGRTRVHIGLDLLIFDVWSLRLFFREWQALYEEPDAPLPVPGVGFRDYVTEAARLAEGPSYEAAREYWERRVDTLPAGPELPLAAPVESIRAPRFRRLASRLDAPAWERVRERAAALGVTPSAVLIAAYATVIGRWSRSPRFSLNIPTFNRLPLHPDIEQVIGDFTSVTLLEIDLSAARGTADLAARIQRQLWADLEHRSYSGVRVLRDLAQRRGATDGLLAPVVFASARGQARDGGPDLPVEWLGEWVHGISQTPQVLLDHQVWEEDAGLAFNWDAVEELFPAGVVDEMFAAYCRVLGELAEDEEVWVSGPGSLLPAGHAALVEAANATDGPVPEGLLYSGVLEWAGERPGKTAVVAADGVLSYGELRDRACAVAHRLRELGVGPGRLVGVALPKGRAQIVAALGVLLAGGAYLPIDPELPAERRRYLVEHGGARIVLTAADGPPVTWPDGVLQQTVDLTEPVPAATPPRPQSPGDLAYVIYTSGSTGLPKGVAVSHRAALNTCADVSERFSVGPGDVVLGLSSLSFDLSVYDVFGVLGAGGTLVLPRPGSGRDPGHWLELVVEHGVTVWNSVPALMAMLVEHAAGASAAVALRVVLLSGDWIPVDLPGRVRALAP